jgi:S-disulfanyl-L-cysteine oxidoreductase SoxD
MFMPNSIATLSLKSLRTRFLVVVFSLLTSAYTFAEVSDSRATASTSSHSKMFSAIGKPLDPNSLNQLTPSIYPDGKGLPNGSGLAKNGAVLYQSQCASCHGKKGEGGTAQELIGGEGPLSIPDADKTLLTYWPYSTTLFDTIMRSMPPGAPGHLSADEIYALCAFIFAENKLWIYDQPMGAKELSSIAMPNRNGFIRKYP